MDAGQLPKAAGVASSTILAGFDSHNRNSQGRARKMHQTLPRQDLARRFPWAAANGKLAEKSRWYHRLWPDRTQGDRGSGAWMKSEIFHVAGTQRGWRGG